VAAVAVVLAGAGALFWLLVNRRRRTRRTPNNFGGYDPGYNGLGSRDDYVVDPKGPVDPLGRTFGGGFVAAGGVNSYSNSGLLDEKSGQSTSGVGGSSSNGATTGHGGVESLSALGYVPPAVIPRSLAHNNNAYSAMAGLKSASGSHTSHEEPSPLESSGFETSTIHSTGSALPSRRGTRKPVPAIGDLPRDSNERKNRTRSNSLNNPSYASSIDELPSQPQPTHAAPSTLNHKGSFGDTKPMNHVLMPDFPLSQN
jgi:hypothetical protein